MYATDQDLQTLRPNILQLGQDNWSAQHQEAARLIDRALDIGWYRPAAAARGLHHDLNPFDPARLLAADTQLSGLGAAKALQLIYETLSKGHPDDTYHHLARHYADRYSDELTAVLQAGLAYDWDDSGTLDTTEQHSGPAHPRTLQRL